MADVYTPDTLPQQQQEHVGVPVINPDGELVRIPQVQMADALANDYEIATPEDIQRHNNEVKYAGTGHAVKAAAEGALSAATFGAGPAIEMGMGVKKEDILGRRQAHETAHTAGEIGGLAASLLVPGFGEEAVAAKAAQAGVEAGALTAAEAAPVIARAAEAINPLSAQSVMTGAGKGLAKAVGLGGTDASVLSKIGAHGVQNAVEMALYQGGDEISKMLINDPQQSLQSAVTDIGLSALLGGAFGAGIGSISPLWKASVGDNLGQFIEDFKGRVGEHVKNPNPADAVHGEISSFHKSMGEMADEVYGAKGLKAQEIERLVPEKMTPKIVSQVTENSDKIGEILKHIRDNPDEYTRGMSSKFDRQINQYLETVTNSDSTAKDIFNATQKVKQFASDIAYSKMPPQPFEDSYSFYQKMKELAPVLRSSLEDPKVWGKAADRQLAINKAFTEYLPALKDFERRFTTQIGGEKVVDPAKINTYMNQIGKPNAELKQEMLKNYIDASEKYKKTIADTHSNLGIESPIEHTPLTASKQTLNKLPAGAKLADVLIKKGIANLSGEAIGGGIGASFGSMLGSPLVGALVGQHALAPFISSILPAIVKPVLESPANAFGMKGAVNYGMAVVRGAKLMEKATHAIFHAAEEVLPPKLIPHEDKRSKLKKMVDSLQQDQSPLLKSGDNVVHYLPQHGEAFGSTALNVVNFLNSIKPHDQKMSPLDSEMQVSASQKAAYNRALDIAEQPLMVLNHVKNGTLMPNDISALNTMYPSLYKTLQTQVTNNMIETVNKGDVIPYKTRLGISQFLQQPLDSTLTQPSISAIQETFIASHPQMASAQAPKSMTKLGQNNKLNLTPSQSREVQRGKI